MPNEANEEQWYPTWKVKKVIEHPRRAIVAQRPIALWVYKGKAFALDANCYHSGGPLEEYTGDLEEIAGQITTQCPVHHFIISIETGESFYKPVMFHKDPKGKMRPVVGEYKSKGVKQRHHFAEIRGDTIWVKLNLSDEYIDSDQFIHLQSMNINF